MPYFFYQGKRCFYTCSGVGPPLLFLHGNTASSQMFQFLLPFYTPCFHCILLDFLGSGRSQRMPELPPQLWIDQGRQAAALIRHLGLGPVFLVGTSGGAWAALNAGLEHPDLVRGIVAAPFTAALTGSCWRSGPQPKRPTRRVSFTSGARERTGRKWWTVTPDLWSGAPGRASPFSPGPWRSCRPPYC